MVLPLSLASADFLNNLLPYQSHFAQISGHQMHYLDEGPREAPVVLCLHGNPTWCFYYRNLLEELRWKFRVIVPDYIGCGLSDHPDAHYRAKQRTEHLEKLLEILGVQNFSLVMHDWGGSIGTSLAIKYPERIDKLVYLNTTLTETESLPKIIKTAALPYIGKFLTKYSMRFLKLTTSLGAYKKLPKNVCEAYYYPYRSIKRRSAIWDFVADIPFDSSHPSYAQMLELANKLPSLADKPVQIVWGLRDPCFHREMLNKVAEHFPQASILEIPDAAHLVLEDAPQVAIPAIAEFLSTGQGAGIARTKEGASAAVQPEQINALYSAFKEQAENIPHKDAVIVPHFFGDALSYTRSNFRDLSFLINKYQRGLIQLGLQAGDRVVMLVTPGIDFLALTYALFARGATPVFIDPGMGKENLFTCLKQIKPQALIGSPKAQLLRLKSKELFPDLRFHLTASEWIYTGGPNLSFLKKFASRPLPEEKAPEIALIAFTSGATGTPKGVIFTNQMLRAQTRIFSQQFGLSAESKDLPLLPIFSIFTLALGVCSVFAPLNPSKPLDLEPDKISRIIDDLEIASSFGSPTLWNKIAEYCIRTRLSFPSLRKVFMAGAPVPEKVLKLVQELLPNGEAYTPYGSTEALPVTLVSASEIVGKTLEPAAGGEVGTFVGKPALGVEIKIIAEQFGPITDSSKLKALEPYQIGEIIVRAASASPAYFDLPEANAKTKISDGDTIWHRMGDLGYLDSSGKLYFCGRQAHALSLGTKRYYSIPTERVFNQHPKVKRSALISLGENTMPAIAIEPHPQDWPETTQAKFELAQELLALGATDPIAQDIKRVFFHPSFPVDSRHNAKIFRDQLSRWACKIERYESAA